MDSKEQSENWIRAMRDQAADYNNEIVPMERADEYHYTIVENLGPYNWEVAKSIIDKRQWELLPGEAFRMLDSDGNFHWFRTTTPPRHGPKAYYRDWRSRPMALVIIGN